MRRKKVLLMGKSGSGKTSMRSIIFADYNAKDTRRLGATMNVEYSSESFLGNLELNIWDCGGQEAFMENYFVSQRDCIFRHVGVLIYVFDLESQELDKDIHYYQSCLEAILQQSPKAKIFCLLHKMDLVPVDQTKRVFEERQENLKHLSKPLKCTCFHTTIWDETLYKAWSTILRLLVPNTKQLKENLTIFAEGIEADTVLLFERATFLVICHWERKPRKDEYRFEKFSNIIKQFKLSCSRIDAQFHSTTIRNSEFTACIDEFTYDTYIMVITTDPIITPAITRLNIQNAIDHFEELDCFR